VAPLLPIARRLAPFTDRIVLALELANLRAAEVTLALKVIDMGWGVTAWRNQLHERRKAEMDALKAAISENCTEIERARRLPLDHTSSLRAHLVTRG
jgi:hypothetical protein